jgi:hypothetical protein
MNSARTCSIRMRAWLVRDGFNRQHARPADRFGLPANLAAPDDRVEMVQLGCFFRFILVKSVHTT